jgi:tetratricopeptide (TPR) repeat protein
VRRLRLLLVPLVLASVCPLAAQFADAVAALQRGDFGAAETRLRAELKLRPKDAETLSLLGVALDNQKKFSEADAFHRQAIAAGPWSTRAFGNYGNHKLLTGDQKGAREAFLKAIAIDPGDRYANLRMAQLAVKRKDGKEALQYLERLPAESPDVAILRLAALDLSGDRAAADAVFARLSAETAKDAALSGSVGMALSEAGQYERAETFLTQALAADPSNFNVLYNVGVVALYAKHYERARDVLETAVRQQPNHVDALYSLAFVYSALKQPEPTLRAAAQAARLAPKRADLQRLIAITAAELHANEDSIAAWDRYVSLAPYDDTGRRERGFARIHLREFETGIADLEWYIARHPDDPVGHYELGLAQSTSDPTKGLASLDKALQLKPDFVAARAARGALNYVQGKPEAAVPDLEAAAASEPSNGLILDRLGQAYRALDRLADAIRVLRRAAELAPAEPTIQLHLGSALSEAGEDKEAESLMDRYRQMRPSQAPRGLMNYLSLTPEQQRADYRARVEKAVRENPGDANAQLHYLKLSLEESRMDQAATAARAISGMRAGAALFADAGRALLEARQFAPAKELLEKAASADPAAGLELYLAIATFHTTGAAEGLRLLNRVPAARRGSDFHLARAQMLAASEDVAGAIQAMDLAITASPKRPDLYWHAAVLLNRNGRRAEAFKLLDRAGETLPQDPQIPLVRAALLELDGQTADAEQLLDQIQRRWPEVAAVWVARGIIHAAHQRFDPARRALETAMTLGARSPEALYYLADSTIRSAPDRLADAEAAVRKALLLAPDDPSLKALAYRIRRADGDYEVPDPGRLFRTRPPQDW